jgi:DNA-binding XRE family transcriptional regulator
MHHSTSSAVVATSRLNYRVNTALRRERAAFGTKVRAARAILALSQDEFAGNVSLTQKSVHRIEQGAVEPKLRTILTIEQYWSDNGISFEDLPDGGFRLVVDGSLLSP